MTSHRQEQLLFFTNTNLTSKNHTLVVTSLVNGGYLYLDRIDIVQDASKPADSNGSATAFPVPPDETGGHTSTSNNTESNNTDVIVGGVLGSIGFILMVVVIAFITRKYHRKKRLEIPISCKLSFISVNIY